MRHNDRGRTKHSGEIVKRRKVLAAAAGLAAAAAVTRIPIARGAVSDYHLKVQDLRQQLRALITDLSPDSRADVRKALPLLQQADHLLAQAYELLVKVV